MVFLKKNYIDPTGRQNFGDAPGQIPKLILTLCHNRHLYYYHHQHHWKDKNFFKHQDHLMAGQDHEGFAQVACQTTIRDVPDEHISHMGPFGLVMQMLFNMNKMFSP